MPYNLNSEISNGSINWDAVNGTNVFSTNFTYSEGELAEPPYGSGKLLNFTSIYKPTDACEGNLNMTKCTLVPALMEYNVMLKNNTILLDPAYNYRHDRVVNILLHSLTTHKEAPRMAVWR
jgi:hypothetical protein